MTDSPLSKGIFPYQHYKTVHALKEATEFPPIESFYSDLKSGITCSQTEYDSAKDLFENRIRLPDGHPDKWSSMVHYLEFYNNADCIPMIHAVKTWFATFEEIFGVDGFQLQSLASMAQKAMMSQFSPYSPLLHSIPSWKPKLLEKLRSNIVGGLCTVLHRAVIMDGSEAPEQAVYAPNGVKYSCIIPFDFNS